MKEKTYWCSKFGCWVEDIEINDLENCIAEIMPTNSDCSKCKNVVVFREEIF